MIRASLPALALAAALPFAAASTAHAGAFGAGDIMASFNAVTSGSMQFTDAQGRVVAGGSLQAAEVDTKGVALGSAFAGFGDGNAYGAGNVQNGNGEQFYWGGSGNTPSGGTAHPAYTFPITSSALFAPLQTLSTNLAGLAGHQVTALAQNNAVLQPTTFTSIGGLNVGVLDITGSVLSGAAGWQFNPNGADVLVINVDTSGGNFSYGGNPNDNFNAKQKVIWNFYDETGSISLAGWEGTILAPGASVTATTPIEGGLYARSLSSGSELHWAPLTASAQQFANAESAVPEPGSLALLGAGIAGLVAWRRRGAARR